MFRQFVRLKPTVHRSAVHRSAATRGWRWCAPLPASVVAGAAGGLAIACQMPQLSASEPASDSEQEQLEKLRSASGRQDGLPEYSREDVSQHNKPGDAWVTYGSGVYDISDFIRQHPGGAKRIMLAVGKAIEPFWSIYQQHLAPDAVDAVVEHLQRMRVGNLKEGEVDPETAMRTEAESNRSINDPFANEPTERSPALKVRARKAFNAETPTALIGDNWITPTNLYFCRHHHPVPDFDAAKYRLKVCGKGLEREMQLSLDNLMYLFPKHEVVVTTQCGGNRRSGMNEFGKTMGISWGAGAISTAKWGGVWLRDVLRLAGLEDSTESRMKGVTHVHFECMDKP